MRPSRSKRIALPMLPSGRVANSWDWDDPAASIPMVPCFPKLTTYRLPLSSTAGPSIPKVYSPAGVTGWLRNVACCAVQGETAIDASASSQSNNIDLFDIVAGRIRALAVQIEVGRTVDAAEGWLFLRLPVDDNDNRVAGNCAALMSRAIEELAVDAAAFDAHSPARHHGSRESIERRQQLLVTRLTGDQVLSAGRHEFFGANPVQPCMQAAGRRIAGKNPAVLRQHEAQRGLVLLQVGHLGLQSEIRMAAVAMFLDQCAADLCQPPAFGLISCDEFRELIDLRLRARVARQRRRPLRGRRVDPDHRLVLVFDQPDRAI